MGQTHNAASGTGWWGLGWELTTWGSPRSSAARRTGAEPAGAASPRPTWGHVGTLLPGQRTESHLLTSQGRPPGPERCWVELALPDAPGALRGVGSCAEAGGRWASRWPRSSRGLPMAAPRPEPPLTSSRQCPPKVMRGLRHLGMGRSCVLRRGVVGFREAEKEVIPFLSLDSPVR